jgi:hypothetical protein
MQAYRPAPTQSQENQDGPEEFQFKTTKLILLDSLLQEVEATLPHLVLQNRKNGTEERREISTCGRAEQTSH